MTDCLTTPAERAALRTYRFLACHVSPLALMICAAIAVDAAPPVEAAPAKPPVELAELSPPANAPATSAKEVPAPMEPTATDVAQQKTPATGSQEPDHVQQDEKLDEGVRLARRPKSSPAAAKPAVQLDAAESAWIPATVLAYGDADWGDVAAQSPLEPEARQPIPLLIWDAVGGVQPVPTAEKGEVATSADFEGDLVPPGAVPAELARAEIAPSVAARPQPNREPAADKDATAKPLSASIDPPSSEQATAAAEPEPVNEPEQTDNELPLFVAKTPLAAEPRVTITREMASLRPRLAKTLQFYFDRPLNTRDDGPWSTMHSLLGYGMQTPLAIGGPRGPRTNAVRWMADNHLCAGRQMLFLDGEDLRGREGQGYQGHPGQFLAILAQIGVPADYNITVNDRNYTVEDLIRAEMKSCRADRELTFTLIALAHYLDSSATWTTESGETWNLGKILGIELSQPVNGAACGGTHRMMAISYALKVQRDRGEPVAGVYTRAQKYLRDYQRYAMSLQLRTGGFSSDWFKRRSDWGDLNRQLQTTGHILEWLVFSLPRNELSDRRVVRAVNFLSSHMTKHRFHDWEVGPRGHALRALALYQQRVFTTSSARKSTRRDQVAWSGLRLRF